MGLLISANNRSGARFSVIGFIRTFLGLDDTPAAYTAAAGQAVVVNQAEDALEFSSDITIDGLNIGGIGVFAGSIKTDGFRHLSSDFPKTNQTLALMPQLIPAVQSGRLYVFHVVLFTTSDAAGGVKAAVTFSGSANILYEGYLINGNTVAGRARSTSAGGEVAAVTAVTAATIYIDGWIQANSDGIILIEFAQNATNATASTVLTGSYMTMVEVGP